MSDLIHITDLPITGSIKGGSRLPSFPKPTWLTGLLLLVFCLVVAFASSGVMPAQASANQDAAISNPDTNPGSEVLVVAKLPTLTRTPEEIVVNTPTPTVVPLSPPLSTPTQVIYPLLNMDEMPGDWCVGNGRGSVPDRNFVVYDSSEVVIFQDRVESGRNGKVFHALNPECMGFVLSWAFGNISWNASVLPESVDDSWTVAWLMSTSSPGLVGFNLPEEDVVAVLFVSEIDTFSINHLPEDFILRGWIVLYSQESNFTSYFDSTWKNVTP